MAEKPDSFAVFLRQCRDNWHIFSALVVMGFFATVAAADASGQIKSQGVRLGAVEEKVGIDSDRLSKIDERSTLTLEYVRQIDANLQTIMASRQK